MPRWKKFGYALSLLTPTLPWQGIWLGEQFGQTNVFAWFSVAIVFGAIPLLDWLVGHDPLNANNGQASRMGRDRYYRLLLQTAAAAHVASVIAGAWAFNALPLSPVGQIGWVVSIGVVSGIVGIVIAHELIHKRSRLDRICGGLLLASVCYGTFKVEHIRGHHADIGTPEDPTTAPFGLSYYRYLAHMVPANFRKAWRIECARLAGEGRSVFSVHNELVWWSALSILMGAGLMVAFGARAVVFFVGQSLVAIALLEAIDYIEHYGLKRRRLADGSYEPVSARHSWNSDFLLTNLYLFQLQRHPDHHLYSRRPYQTLRHIGHSPQLPAGYGAMVVVALIPPLWFALMNPRVPAQQ